MPLLASNLGKAQAPQDKPKPKIMMKARGAPTILLAAIFISLVEWADRILAE